MSKQFFAILTFQFFFSIANATQIPDFPFICSQGAAEKEISPNIVELSFNVKTFDENSDKAFNSLEQKSLELIKLFNEIGIPKDSIESYEIQKTTVRENKEYQELKILGYDMNQKYILKLHDLVQYSSLMNKIVRSQYITDFNSKFGVAERQDIEASLLTEACADAKLRAKEMANSVDAQLDTVYAISEQGFNSIEDAFGLSSTNDKWDRVFKKSDFSKDNSVITFIPPFIKISKKVNVIFKLKIQ